MALTFLPSRSSTIDANRPLGEFQAERLDALLDFPHRLPHYWQIVEQLAALVLSVRDLQDKHVHIVALPGLP